MPRVSAITDIIMQDIHKNVQRKASIFDEEAFMATLVREKPISPLIFTFPLYTFIENLRDSACNG
jgi:hypothetical protein